MLRSVKKIQEMLRVTSEVATQKEHFSKNLQIPKGPEAAAGSVR